MERILIKNLEEEKESLISGHINKIRDTKYMYFIMLEDRSGIIQVSIEKEGNEELTKKLDGVLSGSIMEATGVMKLSEYVKQGGKEFIPSDINILSRAEASPLEEGANLDTRLDYRWIDLKTEKNQLMLKIQSTLVEGMREYLYKEEFTEIHTPKLIGAASESGSEVFEVNYFDRKAYLAQSPQFYKQMVISSGFDRVFEVAPCFRAENSNTSKHATEFTSFDVEFAYIDSYNDVMRLESEMINYAFKKVKEDLGEEIKRIFDIEIKIPKLPFPTMKLEDIYKELEERYGYKVDEEEKTDLTTEAEKLCAKLAKDKFKHQFLFVTDFPAEKRAFYHMRNEEGKLQGYDLIWNGIEITTGAQREHRYEEIVKNAKEKGLDEDVKFYLEFFKYGCPPHGGFAIGLDRLTMLFLNISTVKEAMLIFRGPNRLNP